MPQSLALALFLFCFANADASAALAQESSAAASSAALSAIVQDPSGAIVPHARVLLESSTGAQLQETSSDSIGSFHFDQLPAGSYRLIIQAPGFKEEVLTVKLGAKRLAPLHIALSLASQRETLTVGGADSSPQVSTQVSQNQNANSFDRATLDRVPVFDQDYVTTLSRFLDDNTVATSGVSLVVNGIEANGPGVPPSGIQEVKINQNPYSALFANPGRARLEITSKPGTPDFHGTLNFLFRDSVFDATNAFAVVKPPENREYYEGSLTGPLGHDKRNTFLLALERDLDAPQAVVSAIGLSGLIQENVPAPIHHLFFSGRAFHECKNGDLFWVGYSYENQSFGNMGVGGTVLPAAGYHLSFFEHEVNFSYRHAFSNAWANQLRFLLGHYNRRQTNTAEAPAVIVSGAFTGGSAQRDTLFTEYHFDGTDILTYAHGKQLLNFGVDIPDLSRRGGDDFTNRLGAYTFADLGAYQAHTPSSVVIQSGNAHRVFFETVIAGFMEDTIRVSPRLSLSVGLRYYRQNYFHDVPDNFAPRFSLAFAPTAKGKFVFRGGAGLFYDRTGPRPIFDLLNFNGRNLQRFILDHPPYPVTPADLVGVPSSVVTLDPRLRIPYRFHYSFGIERQVTAKSTLSATYVGSRGIELFRSIDANAPLAPNYSVRPDLLLGQDRQIQSDGYQKSNGLELTFRGDPSRFFSGQVQYTLSKTYNNTTNIMWFPANSYDPAADWARSDTDRRHKFDMLGSTHVGDVFTFGVALSLYSGLPVNVTTGGDNNGDGVVNDRPLGYARNTLHGPGLINLDLNIAHDFRLHKEKQHPRTLTVSLNSFNVLNHPNDVTYIGVITSPLFGQAVAALPPRRTQLNLEYKF